MLVMRIIGALIINKTLRLTYLPITNHLCNITRQVTWMNVGPKCTGFGFRFRRFCPKLDGRRQAVIPGMHTQRDFQRRKEGPYVGGRERRESRGKFTPRVSCRTAVWRPDNIAPSKRRG